MNTIQSIIEDISYLQVKIPEELFKVKEGLEEYCMSDEFSENDRVKILLKDNKKLKKKNKKLTKKIEEMEKWISSLLRLQSPSDHNDIDHNKSSENITYNLIDVSEVHIKQEPISGIKEIIVIDDDNDIHESTVVGTQIEESNEIKETEEIGEDVEEEVIDEEVEEEVIEEDVVEEEVVEEEIEVEEEVVEEDVEEEVVEEDVEEEDVEEEVVEEDVEEEVVEEDIEEEVVEEDVVKEEVIEEEDEVYEVTIKGKTYYVTNEIDSIIYDTDENGDVSLEVGKYNKGKPVFYKK